MRGQSPLEDTEQRLLPAPARGLVIALTLTAVAAVSLLMVFGWGVHPVERVVVPPPAAEATPIQSILRLFLAVAVIGGLASLGGIVARRIGQPSVVGQIVAGLLLGPSALGTLAPAATELIMPAAATQHLNLLAQAGLAIFIFTVGTEFDHTALSRQRTVVGVAALAMVAVPFALGTVAAIPFASALVGPTAGRTEFVLFIGTALSVTALPVLARILQEVGLTGTRLGSLAVLCAGIADVLAWCALAAVIALAHARSPAGALTTMLLAAALVLVVFLVVRPALRTLADRYAETRLPAPAGLVLVLGLIFSLAAATDAIGAHAIFGALLAGIVIPRNARVLGTVPDRLASLNRALLLPVFFASIGLQADVRMAFDDPAVLLGGAVLLVAAVLGKLGTAAVTAWAGGMPGRLALGLGVLMNARGVTEIVVLSTGLSIGVIGPGTFTVLMLMALITTVMTVPALRLLGLCHPERTSPAPMPRPAEKEHLA
ncbi:cation:proton antiporter [Nonomuraea aurantiaca]|uniref:cation:proton antiporter n=1 Tax=Nonomuraea aurantiaca TaxID=2878562 RepID=UPI001CD97E01|nr:cation:proton antiporter [Nonomuraea aurantiaca]MCA2220780.1 cation:proton antiporter [Nonomuraea aurantiaca]